MTSKEEWSVDKIKTKSTTTKIRKKKSEFHENKSYGAHQENTGASHTTAPWLSAPRVTQPTAPPPFIKA